MQGDQDAIVGAIGEYRGPDCRSRRRAKTSPLETYREHITWENAFRLTPGLIETFGKLDPGARTGCIQIRNFRGSIMEHGSKFQVSLSLPADGGPARSRTYSVRTPDDNFDSKITAVLRCMSFCIETAGLKPAVTGYGTNTGEWRISLAKTRGNCYALSTSLRLSTSNTGFAPLRFNLGNRDCPEYPKLYSAAMAMMKLAVAEEASNRPIPGAITDRAKWQRRWKDKRAMIVGSLADIQPPGGWP